MAAKSGNTALVRWLVNKGANLNAKDDNWCTPLHLAAQAKDSNMVILNCTHRYIIYQILINLSIYKNLYQLVIEGILQTTLLKIRYRQFLLYLKCKIIRNLKVPRNKTKINFF